ncbi:hypothetical protein E9993_12890 [Labilibacter sediminis]|nr:hypothetical protein E9993_12890 [Labilibacter sediminis]
MNYLNNIRVKISAYLLNQRLKKNKRNPIICNLKQAKTVGILFNSVLKEDIKTVKQLEADLKEQNTKVEILGFANIKRNGETLIGDNQHHYIYKNDFNWIYKPKNPELQSFLTKKYDILINLYQDDIFAVESMVKTSDATFKVGCAHLHPSWHDLMIDVGSKKGDSNYLSEQINHYLSMINS